MVKIDVRVFFGETAKAARKLARAAPHGLPASARQPPREVAVRLYVMRASSLCAADGMLGGSALRDPYVRAHVGAGAAGSNAALPDGVGMERGDALPQTLEPQFYRSFELATTVPGPSRLHVRVLDKNLGLSQAADDLVGELVVDVEDRWFDPAWQALAKKPAERRALSLPDRSSACTQAARGYLSFCESPRAVRGGYFGVRAQTCVCEPACRVRRWVLSASVDVRAP